MKNNIKVDLALTRKKLIILIITANVSFTNTETNALKVKDPSHDEAIYLSNDYHEKRPYLRIGEPLDVQPGDYRGPRDQDIYDLEDKEIKSVLEDKFRFRSEGRLPRYKIERHKGNNRSPNLGWAFRSYAVRRIVGGMETHINMYPYNVAIARNGKHWCGGSVIDEQWVLTAGHCLELSNDSDSKKLLQFIVRAGSSSHNRGGYQAKVNRVFFPPLYSSGNADYDMSLLRLDRPLPIGKNIAVLNLPAKEYSMKSGDILIVTGWGSTDETGYGKIPERLRFVPVPVLSMSSCQKSYSFYITPRMVCAGYATGGMDACNHDSGGPAVKDGVLLGVVSFGGKRCGDPQSPGVYTRVSELTDWVESTITNNEANEVPELIEKIKEARVREQEMKTFKSRVEDKKAKIKIWLKEALKSPVFIELAKQKLDEAEMEYRRNGFMDLFNESNYESDADENIDVENVHNLINDKIFDDETDPSENLVNRLALKEVINSDPNISEKIFSEKQFSLDNDVVAEYHYGLYAEDNITEFYIEYDD